MTDPNNPYQAPGAAVPPPPPTAPYEQPPLEQTPFDQDSAPTVAYDQPAVPTAPYEQPVAYGQEPYAQPGYAQPTYPQQPGYDQSGYPQPAYPQPAYGEPAAPPGAYGVPVGGYAAPLGGYAVPPATPPASKLTGALSLIAGLVALIAVPVVASILAFQIGVTVPIDQVLTDGGDVILEGLAPVRPLVLWVEIMFWLGTALGLFAIVIGIIAIVKKRGRGMGITGLILAVIAPGAYYFGVALMWGIGTASGLAQTL